MLGGLHRNFNLIWQYPSEIHYRQIKVDKIEIFTALCVCVCPTSIRMLEQMIERQKLIRMIDLSDLMYLKKNGLSKLHSSKSAMALFVISLVHLCTYLHRTAYTTASVIKARQDRPQPTISVTDGTPEYSIACEWHTRASVSDFQTLVPLIKAHFSAFITGSLLVAAQPLILHKFRGLKRKLFLVCNSFFPIQSPLHMNKICFPPFK